MGAAPRFHAALFFVNMASVNRTRSCATFLSWAQKSEDLSDLGVSHIAELNSVTACSDVSSLSSVQPLTMKYVQRLD